MRPPDWAISGAERLTMETFGPAFRAAWAKIQRRWLKLECWQEYQEPHTKSLHAFLGGQPRDRVIELLGPEAALDQEFYDDLLANPIDRARIRVVRLPLTAYLQWEMINYEVREELGERIVFVDDSGSQEPLPNSRVFDFVLFDRHTALVHDYGDDGLQRGGWLVTEPEALDALERIAVELRERAIPLDEFAARL